MLNSKLQRSLLALACASLVTTASAFAQGETLDKKVYYTFNNKVEIPGATLDPGRYLFHLADPTSGRQVLQVQSGDGKKVYSMFFSVPIERAEASDKPEVRFYETPAGSPAAIHTVWYGGEKTGRELIYPRDQAMRIAKASNQPVLTTHVASSSTKEPSSGDLTHVSPAGQDTQASASAEGRSQFGSDDFAAPPPQQMAQNNTPSSPVRDRLPDTASDVPALLFVGLGLMLGAAGIRLVRTSGL